MHVFVGSQTSCECETFKAIELSKASAETRLNDKQCVHVKLLNEIINKVHVMI